MLSPGVPPATQQSAKNRRERGRETLLPGERERERATADTTINKNWERKGWRDAKKSEKYEELLMGVDATLNFVSLELEVIQN